jgi:vacuolar protein sorting-associated protein IST1
MLISAKVMKKLVLSTPSPELVDAYLFEIAKGYGVSWSPPTPLAKEGGGDGDQKGTEGDAKVYLALSTLESTR